MATPSTCANCGAPLAGDERKGFCPKCLFAQAQSGLFDFKMDGDFGDYELLDEIGRGGMGVVYRARQRSLDRLVAIKRMVFGPGSNPELVKRFRAEAVSAATLRHPNIVAIHEVGVHEGQHFFVMDYVQGQSMAHLVAARPLPARRAAGYLKTLAEAVHYAHERGILHRDLKPSNVLIDEQDQPRIVDFGLARRLEGASELTVTGQVLGSPHYLPPEQATAQRGRVSRRTDVYGLGATLYHLLTGRPPFQAESLAQTLDLVLHTEPVAPRLLNPGVPRDLETICLKCLEKEPSRRYPTAQALADELGRFQGGEPIRARPLGLAGQMWRWCRRKPQAASLAAVAALAVVLGFAGVLWQWRHAEAQRRRAEQQAYISDINAAQAALKENNPGRALQLLNRNRPAPARSLATRHASLVTDLRGFEWRYLWQQCQSGAEILGRVSTRVNCLEVSSDGHWLVASCDAGAVTLWNLSTDEEISLASDRGWPNYATFSTDSRLLLASDQTSQSQGTAAAWDLQTRTKRPVPVLWDQRPMGPIVFSPDGKWLGVSGVGPKTAEQVAADPQLARTLGRKRVVILEFPSLRKAREVSFLTLQLYMDKGLDWVFTADNRSLIFAETEPVCRIALWDFAADAKPHYFPGHREGIAALALSPDGRVLATGSGYTDHVIRLWEIPSFRSMGELNEHEAWIAALKFSPDGQILASAGADQTIRLWHLPAKQSSRIYRGLAAETSRVCFAPDSRTLFSAGVDGTIYRWSAEAREPEREQEVPLVQTGLGSMTVSSDCTQCAGLRQGSVYLGKTDPGALPIRTGPLGTNNNCLLFSAAGDFLLSGTWTGEIQVWSLHNHQIQASLRGVAEPACWLGQDARGSILVAVHRHSGAPTQAPPRPHTVSVWSMAQRQLREVFAIPGIGGSYAVSPDGAWLAAGLLDVQLWSLTDPLKSNTLAFPGWVVRVAFSPDAKLLAAATSQGTVRVWKMPGFHDLEEFRAASGALSALVFSSDSRRLVTASARQRGLQVWDVATWRQLIAVQSAREIDHVSFSADGNQFTGVDSQGDILTWRVPSLAEIEAKENKQKAH
jgi:WD40 repeat protein/predicted Ser/Thr protein kinase